MIAMHRVRETRGSLVCLLCSRTAGTAQGTNRAISQIRPNRPEYAEAVRQLRCPDCGGRLWICDAETVRDDPRPDLTEDEIRPRPGRPRKGALP